MSNKASLRELIYAFLLAASKTCLFECSIVQNLELVIQKLVKLTKILKKSFKGVMEKFTKLTKGNT